MFDKFKGLREISKLMALYVFTVFTIGGIIFLCRKFAILSCVLDIISYIAWAIIVWGFLEWVALIIKMLIGKFRS